MKVIDLITAIQTKKLNSATNAHSVIGEYAKKTLKIRTYIPFMEKKQIADLIVEQNTKFVDGIWKNDAINQYICFVIAMLKSHTDLEFGADPIADYDALAENNLLTAIIDTFQTDYNECEVVLKMALASKLEDNNVNVLVGHFLNSILNKLDNAGEFLKSTVGELDLNKILGESFNHEDLAKLSSFLNR